MLEEYPALKAEDIQACLDYASKLMANRYSVVALKLRRRYATRLEFGTAFRGLKPTATVTSSLRDGPDSSTRIAVQTVLEFLPAGDSTFPWCL